MEFALRDREKQQPFRKFDSLADILRKYFWNNRQLCYLMCGITQTSFPDYVFPEHTKMSPEGTDNYLITIDGKESRMRKEHMA
jgi:hypothetical protein